MALIKCPNCGKEVSDTNGKCFHCGFSFVSQNEEELPPQEYSKFSAPERESVRKEFYKQHPKYDSYMQKLNKFLKLVNITAYVSSFGALVFMIYWVALRIYHAVSKKDTSKILIILFFILLIVWIVALIINVLQRKVLYKKYRRNELIIEKNFQKWLKEEKNINYTVAFTEKQKKDKEFFVQIDVDKDEIEV